VEKAMTSKYCKKCRTSLAKSNQACPNCGEKPSMMKQIMAWFCIILLFIAGLFWAFTDSEPDVTIDPTANIE